MPVDSCVTVRTSFSPLTRQGSRCGWDVTITPAHEDETTNVATRAHLNLLVKGVGKPHRAHSRSVRDLAVTVAACPGDSFTQRRQGTLTLIIPAVRGTPVPSTNARGNANGRQTSGASSDPVVQADGLVVRRGDDAVLDGLSLTVARNERCLIQGPSGAGKTTLFSVLGLLEPPDEGTLTIGDQDTADMGERQRARLRRDAVGIVFQDFQLVPDLTAWENASLPQEHTGSRDDEWLDTLFERLEIADCRDDYPATLSGGEQQRVAVARALANRPAVVLADEPTGQLDPEASERVLDLLDSLQEEADTALVVVSHDRSLVPRFQTVYRLVDGRLGDGT